MSKSRYTWTEEKNKRFLKEGRGSGELCNYKPWLTIYDVPSEGRAHRPKGWKTQREHQLLSDIELGYFYYLEWSDKVIDIREQFPLNLEDTLKIATTKNIPHPIENSTQTEIVMTTDFLITSRIGNEIVYSARSIKPSNKIEDPRVLEKQEIERQYWEDKNIQWLLIDELVLNKQFVKNIDYVHEYYNLTDKEEEEMSLLFLDYLFNQSHKDSRKKLIDCCNEFDLLYNLEIGSSIYYLRHLYARKYITPQDMEQPILPYKIILNEVTINKGGFRKIYGTSIG